MQFIIEILKETFSITFFVLVMMMLIEYVNIKSRGSWTKILEGSTWLQILLSAFLGLIPGCLGSFIVVSLYIHRLVRLGALIAALIASFGDEAYILLGLNPAAGLKIMLILFVIAICIGFIVDLFTKNKQIISKVEPSFKIHKNESICGKADKINIISNFRNITSTRAFLIFGLVFYIIAVILGFFGENHDHGHSHSHDGNSILEFGAWLNYTYLSIASITLVIVSIVSDHFIEVHFWGHVLKHHFLKIFLWTFGALLSIHLLLNFVDIDAWVSDNYIWILVLALVIGLIPESGPHLLFITLFVNGVIPISILLANSIVQDGHASLPLFAESKKSFVIIKAVKLIIGFVVGILGFWMKW